MESFRHVVLFFFFFLSSLIIYSSICIGGSLEGYSLDSVRSSLTRMEDSIVFSLIERAKYPINSPTYSPSHVGDHCTNCSVVEFFVRETEKVEAKAGRYQSPEELPFFPDNLPSSLVPAYNYTKILYPAAASINVTNTIWNTYFNDLLPLFTSKGDDGNYGLTSASDLICLQLLSRRIHYGRFVAEAKFREAPQNYTPAIHAQDKDALLELVTVESVEKMVQKRVEKKAMVFGQDVTLETNTNTNDTSNSQVKYKVNPIVASRLYGEWVIPLTKLIEVEYLLHRLD